MGLLIDSNVWIEHERGRFVMPDFLARQSEKPVAIASIIASELLHGLHRTATPTVLKKRRDFVEAILAWVRVIPFDLSVARTHAALWAETAASKKRVGDHDLMIAATALHFDYELVSFNYKDFREIPGLKLVVPKPI